MSLIGIAALIALAALVLWAFGGVLGRIGGALMTLTALVSLLAGGPVPSRLGLLGLGLAVWLGGHVVTVHKTRRWHSRVAAALVTRTPLRILDPARPRRTAAPATTGARGRRPAPAIDHFAAWEDELTGRRNAAEPTPYRTTEHRGRIYTKRAAQIAGRYAVRAVPGGHIARSAYRFLR